MRTLAAVAVIILISSLNINANERHEINDLESLKSSLQKGGGDQKAQKDVPFNSRGCPACDSSVYSYCDQKIFHDACCCGLGGVQPQCQYSDCSYIYANSCKEHQLITNCCCYSPFRNA